MGIKAVDLNPVSTIGPTAISPGSKYRTASYFQVTRTTTTLTLKDVLPADASLVNIYMFGSINSDAATTATVTLTLFDNTNTLSTGVVDVKANGATSAIVQMSSLPNLEKLPLNGDLRITAVYAETGTASTTGGPWTFEVNFVR